MQQPLQPMFQKGDKVIYLYLDGEGKIQPEICTIDAIILGDYIIFYELQELAEVVMESELVPLDEAEDLDQDTDDVEEETIVFEQNYNYGDLVYVEGYDEQVYKVEGIIIEIYRYQNEEWTEVSYELEKDGMCIYAYDEDMSLVRVEQSNGKEPLQPQSNLSGRDISPQEKKESLQIQINQLLDDYNDYQTLYHLFKDEEYQELVESVLEELKALSVAIERL
jgi:hypothetical protein